MLVAGATMLARSLNKLEHQHFGYQTDGRVVVSLNPPPATYTQPQLASLYRQIEDGMNRLPGVTRIGPCAIQSADGQLGRTHSGVRPSAAQHERRLRALPGTG